MLNLLLITKLLILFNNILGSLKFTYKKSDLSKNNFCRWCLSWWAGRVRSGTRSQIHAKCLRSNLPTDQNKLVRWSFFHSKLDRFYPFFPQKCIFHFNKSFLFKLREPNGNHRFTPCHLLLVLSVKKNSMTKPLLCYQLVRGHSNNTW